MAVLGRDGRILLDSDQGTYGLGSYYVLGQDRVAEASHITPGGLEKAFLAAGHDLGFLWGSIWSEGLGEDRETMKVSVVEEIILGTWF